MMEISYTKTSTFSGRLPVDHGSTNSITKPILLQNQGVFSNLCFMVLGWMPPPPPPFWTVVHLFPICFKKQNKIKVCSTDALKSQVLGTKTMVQLTLVCNVTIICLHTLLPDVFTDFFPTCDIRDVAQTSRTPLANY
jgi:hypothetical protein